MNSREATMRIGLTLFTLVYVALSTSAAEPEDPAKYLKTHYTKYEHRIPMRDGTRLMTAIYVPKDDAKPVPVMLFRTPYSVGPYGVDNYPERVRLGLDYLKAGYIFVNQDVRGCWMSEGEFVNMRPHVVNKGPKDFDESSDTFDTIDWVLKNIPGHNDRVGQWGISYPGFYTVCGMIDSHPKLVASSPQAPVTDWFMGDDFHHNGALFLPHCFNFMGSFGKARPGPVKKNRDMPFDHGTPDGYKFFLELGALPNADAKFFKGKIAFWNDVMEHDTYDAFWQAKNIRPHIKNVKPAVLTVGGWFDAENLFGPLETDKAVAKTGGAKGGQTLVMGPWVHGGWNKSDGDKLGDVGFNTKTAEYYRDKIEFPFFEHHLRGDKPEMRFPRAWVFETGTNVWRKYDAWPPVKSEPKDFYLLAGGALSHDKPSSKTGADEFTSDPAKPVPFFNKTVIGMDYDYMTGDQRFVANRPDVLVYQTPVLEADTTLTGEIQVELHVATTGTDADFIVKVIDVFPDDYPEPKDATPGVKMAGYQQLIRGDVMRGKFRNSFEKPEAFTPGKPTLVTFTLPAIHHTFRPGHRLMVQVQSTWFPLVDLNPQTFTKITTAKPSDFVKQSHTIFRNAENASLLRVQVMQ
jgi:uncharacterized protein